MVTPNYAENRPDKTLVQGSDAPSARIGSDTRSDHGRWDVLMALLR